MKLVVSNWNIILIFKKLFQTLTKFRQKITLPGDGMNCSHVHLFVAIFQLYEVQTPCQGLTPSLPTRRSLSIICCTCPWLQQRSFYKPIQQFISVSNTGVATSSSYKSLDMLYKLFVFLLIYVIEAVLKRVMTAVLGSQNKKENHVAYYIQLHGKWNYSHYK